MFRPARLTRHATQIDGWPARPCPSRNRRPIVHQRAHRPISAQNGLHQTRHRIAHPAQPRVIRLTHRCCQPDWPVAPCAGGCGCGPSRLMMSPATAKSRRLVIDPKVCRRSQWHNGSHVTVAVVLPHSQHEGGNSNGLRSDAVTGYALRAHTQGTGAPRQLRF